MPSLCVTLAFSLWGYYTEGWSSWTVSTCTGVMDTIETLHLSHRPQC